jgi:hypothetical protein
MTDVSSEVRELAETQAALPEDASMEVRARALPDQWMDRLARDRESVVLHMEFIAHAGRTPSSQGDLALAPRRYARPSRAASPTIRKRQEQS